MSYAAGQKKDMKTALLCMLPAALLFACTLTVVADEMPAVTPLQKTELFNGKDFTGWKLFMKDGADPAQSWSIENGLLKCTGTPHGYMRTEQAYKDYRVSVEWRFTTPGNTGVLVHMGLPDKIWPRSFECQGMHKHQGDIWLWDGADCKEPKIPGKNGFTRPVKSAENPPGEWNTYQVECAGNSIRILVNGKPMNAATECNASSGFIGLQCEGGAIEVRKVTIEPLTK